MTLNDRATEWLEEMRGNRVAIAVRQGDRLQLGCLLTYTDRNANSDKFHGSMLVGRHILVQFGRQGAPKPQVQAKSFETPDKAYAAYWGLLRSKVAKGYYVTDSGVYALSTLEHDLDNPLGPASGGFYALDALEALHVHSMRLKPDMAERPRLLNHPDVQIRSPRTPKQGAAVIATLTNPTPDPDDLFEISLAADSERFARPMALSHPACPDEAKAAWALLKMATANPTG